MGADELTLFWCEACGEYDWEAHGRAEIETGIAIRQGPPVTFWTSTLYEKPVVLAGGLHCFQCKGPVVLRTIPKAECPHIRWMDYGDQYECLLCGLIREGQMGVNTCGTCKHWDTSRSSYEGWGYCMRASRTLPWDSSNLVKPYSQSKENMELQNRYTFGCIRWEAAEVDDGTADLKGAE